MFRRNTSCITSFPPVQQIVSFSLSIDPLLIRRIRGSSHKSIGGILQYCSDETLGLRMRLE